MFMKPAGTIDRREVELNMNKRMKKSIAALFALSISVTGGAAYAANDNVPQTTEAVVISQSILQQIQIAINNEALAANGYIKADAKEPMLPLRDVAETLGIKVTWNEADQSAELSKGALWTSVKLGEDRYVLNKMYKSLGTAPELTDSKTYVPASFVSEILHSTVKIEGSSVSITSEQQRKTTSTKGVITAVYANEGRQTVQINGIGTDGLVLNLGTDTVFEKADGTKLSFTDLALGMEIEAEHSLAATLSLPPQTPTYKITVLEQSEAKGIIGTAGVIEEVRTGDDGTTSLRIKGTGLTEQTPSEVVLRLAETTEFINVNGETVEKSSLEKGAKVIGYYNGVLTRSLPPIGTAWKIVLQAPAADTSSQSK
ncbi:MAG: hypothetical protein K0R28_3571 [Paenibacillus sp.]|jgi:hypothetical protein|nr:hypothetical protein [Paenibacillus sp.]